MLDGEHDGSELVESVEVTSAGVVLERRDRYEGGRELSAICKLAHEICGPRFFPF